MGRVRPVDLEVQQKDEEGEFLQMMALQQNMRLGARKIEKMGGDEMLLVKPQHPVLLSVFFPSSFFFLGGLVSWQPVSLFHQD